MKGIITDYIEEKGFGFIKDENEDKRFFHISNVNEKDKFLSNLADYYFTDWEERICYVVNFVPGKDSKGLNAKNIILTNQIFNDKSLKNSLEVFITDFQYHSNTLTRIVSGIKNGIPVPSGATKGGHGTYRMGYPEAFRELNILYRRVDDIGWGTIDVRDLVLSLNNRSKITAQLIATLKALLVGRKIIITPTNTGWSLSDSSLLKI